MVSPLKFGRAVVDPILGPPKPKTLVRDSQRISCNPTQTQIVDVHALAHDPVYGPIAHNGFNILIGLNPCPTSSHWSFTVKN